VTLGNQSQRVLAVLIIKNPDIFCDQTTKWIQRQTANACFDASLAQFLHYTVTPLPAKASFGEVITAAGNPDGYTKKRKAHEDHEDSTSPG